MSICREAMYGGFWKKHNICTPAHGSPARLVRYVFSATKYSQILSRRWGGSGVCEVFFWRRRVRTDQRRDEGVETGGGQMGSNARARRSLAVASPARALGFPLGRGLMLRMAEDGRSRRSGTVWRRRSVGSPAAGKARHGGFWKNSRTHHLLRTGDLIPVFFQPLP
jgi:hypothetical protein